MLLVSSLLAPRRLHPARRRSHAPTAIRAPAGDGAGPERLTLGLFRIGVSGAVYTLREPADATWYGHGIVWGTGRGGWDELSIYQPLPNHDQSVGRVELGVPPASWDGDVVGVSPY